MNTNNHYGITTHSIYGHITNLYCKHCDFIVWKPHHAGGKSGLTAYNKMRGEMVKHLHSEHRDKLLA